MSLDRATLDVLASMAQEIAALRARVSDLEGQESYPLTTRGDLLTRSATRHTRLAIGTTGKFLKTDGTDPSWQTIAAADLSNYSSGTWAPDVSGSVTPGTTTYAVDGQIGHYRKIGDWCEIWGRVVWTAQTGSGNYQVSLPFTARNSTNYRAELVTSIGSLTFSGYVTGDIVLNTALFTLIQSTSGGARAAITIAGGGGAGTLVFSGSFLTT
jgi:hypothetical protein